MKAEEKKLITGSLEKILNISTDEVAQLFKENGTEFDFVDDAQKKILDFNISRIKVLKDAEELAFKNGQKKATKEFGENRDKEIKEKFGVDSDKIGLELVEEIVTTKTKVPDLDDDKVKIHPVYTKAEKDAAKKLKETEDALTKKYEDREKEIAREKTFSTITKTAKETLTKLKPIFGTTDEAKIQNQIERLLLSDLKAFEFIDQNGETIVMKDGKRLEDAHGKPITFETLIKENAAKHWEFETGDNRSGAGASNDDAAKAAAAKAAAGKKYNGKLPKTDAEFQQVFANEKDAEQRVLLVEEFEKSQAAAV